MTTRSASWAQALPAVHALRSPNTATTPSSTTRSSRWRRTAGRSSQWKVRQIVTSDARQPAGSRTSSARAHEGERGAAGERAEVLLGDGEQVRVDVDGDDLVDVPEQRPHDEAGSRAEIEEPAGRPPRRRPVEHIGDLGRDA